MEELSGAAAFASTSVSNFRDTAAIDSDDERPPQPFPQTTSFSHHSHLPVSPSTSVPHFRDAAAIDSYDERPPQPFPQRTSFPHHSHRPVTADEDAERRFTAASTGSDGSPVVRDDAWSCIIVVITFWFFVSMTLIFGVYGSEFLWLGPNSSILIKPHPLFVEHVKVEQLDNVDYGPMLYGFYGTPSLDVVTDWSEYHKTTLPGSTHKEWMYFLNSGSQINVSCSLTSVGSSSIVLIIAQGSEGLARWLEDPSYPNTTLLWHVIHGTGDIGQGISKSSIYYIAVGNLNTDAIKVQLNFGIRALLYNTTNAYYRCNLGHGQCGLKILFPGRNSALLATPSYMPDQASHKWHVKLSYGPRWITYLGSIGGLTILMLLALRFFNNSGYAHQDESEAQFRDIAYERTPLISRKDDDLSSLGSSYDSVSQDEEHLDDGPALGSVDGNPTGDGEYKNNMRHLCAICFDAPRDCFFIPCGHCVSCYACGMRVAEAAGICPICRRHMKKVRKIYTV